MSPRADSDTGGPGPLSSAPRRIGLGDLELRGGKVRCRLTLGGGLERYFRGRALEMSYDFPADAIGPSILYIPFVAAVLPVALLAGGDIAVRMLDEEYLRSVMLVQDKLKEWRPGLPFCTKIVSDERVTNVFAEDGRCGVLFSGGLDSTSSFLTNKENVSTLVMVGGTEDLPLRDRHYWERIRDLAASFAKRNGVAIHFAESNWLDVLDASHLVQDFAVPLAGPRRRDDVTNWEEVFRLALLGICAPVAACERLRTLLMASTYSAEVLEALGIPGFVEKNLRWGDLAVGRDSEDLTRQQKIRNVIAPYLRENEGGLPLRVCHPINLERNRKLRQRGLLNCSECPKCRRTMLGLLLDGIDPRRCGFEQGSFSSERIRQQLANRSIIFTGSLLEFWTDMKRHIDDRPSLATELNLWNTNGFFDWLASYDLTRNLATSNESVDGGIP